jgi:hypothetical protein
MRKSYPKPEIKKVASLSNVTAVLGNCMSGYVEYNGECIPPDEVPPPAER